MSTTLKALNREQLGSRPSRALRREGRIPANIQATAEAAHLDISIDEDEFLSSRRHHEHLYDIDVNGQEETAIVRELQWDVFGQRISHVEFRRVVRGVEMESEVELSFEGMPKSGILNHLVTHIEIRSIPSLIPDNIEVPCGRLIVGDTIFARDLKLPEGISLGVEEDLVIAVCREMKVVAEPTGDEDEDGLEGLGEGDSSASTPAD